MSYQWLRHRNKICNFPYLPYETIRNFQIEKIKKIVSDAYNYIPFYKELYSSVEVDPKNINSFSDFEKLPTISKSDIVGKESLLIDKRYDNKDLICSKTSGTSGMFLDIFCDMDMFATEELQVIRMIKELYPNYNSFSREVLVYTSKYPVASMLGFYRAYYVNNLKSAEYIFNFILDKKPSVLAIYPSILNEIIKTIKFDFNKLNLKLIITNSEQSTQQERALFSKLFGCMVIDEFSSEELQSIAYQCEHYNYHEVSDCTVIEILSLDSDKPVCIGEVGEITGTCLINKAMPLIRYRQGDLAVRCKNECMCGKNTPIIGQPIGRNNSSFISINGNIIPSGRLLDWSYSLVLKHNFPISEFQIVQEDLCKVNIYIKTNDTSDELLSSVKGAFVEIFGNDFAINVVPVPELKKTASGKLIPILSKVDKNNMITI